MGTPRPGSRKAEVYAHFHSHGPDAALEFGTKLELARGTLLSWVKTWGKSKEEAPRKSGEPSTWHAAMAEAHHNSVEHLAATRPERLAKRAIASAEKKQSRKTGRIDGSNPPKANAPRKTVPDEWEEIKRQAKKLHRDPYEMIKERASEQAERRTRGKKGAG